MVEKLSRHHILYPRTAWLSNTYSRELRSNPQLLIPVENEAHAELHESVSYVPLLSPNIVQMTLSNFEDYGYTNEPARAISNLQQSIENAANHRRADYVSRQVAKCAIYALTLQKPYLRRYDRG